MVHTYLLFYIFFPVETQQSNETWKMQYVRKLLNLKQLRFVFNCSGICFLIGLRFAAIFYAVRVEVLQLVPVLKNLMSP